MLDYYCVCCAFIFICHWTFFVGLKTDALDTPWFVIAIVLRVTELLSSEALRLIVLFVVSFPVKFDVFYSINFHYFFRFSLGVITT